MPAFILFAALFALFSCSLERENTVEPAALDSDDTVPPAEGPRPVPRGDRLIGLDILNLSEDGTFADNIRRAQSLGAQFVSLHTTWTAFEPSPGVLVDPENLIRTFIDVLQTYDLKLSLTVRPIDLTGKTVPSDLETTRFSDPVMMQRFQNLLTFLFGITGSDGSTTLSGLLTSLQIGNEIDGYDSSGEHPDFWSDYGAFLYETNLYVESNIDTGLPVGFTGTRRGLIDEDSRAIFQALAGAVDVVGATYYPLDSGLRVEDPAVVAADLQALVDTFTGHTVYLQEVGYPTADKNASDQQKQADFYKSLFLAWDTHRQEIPLINIVRLQDVSRATAEELAGDYTTGNEEFVEYLRTLGLRTHPEDGVDKVAFTVIRQESGKRGWILAPVPPRGTRVGP
jgi:hypothetical protein